ncbi:MAG: macro domain-containing protein [Lachnospiraceae bacterium]|nr:macro domain-containing protein [Lachnospiraceae bacterium]
MTNIRIQKKGITQMEVDAIVNAANEGLWEGGGVCGAIFREAGSEDLTKACKAIGGCKTGSAVITPAFKLPAKYIIHAVGPRWNGGDNGEPEQLYGAYAASLELAKENNCHSIAFPVISAGIFGYPKKEAWHVAIQACNDFIRQNREYDISIFFAVLDSEMMDLGGETLEEIAKQM